MEWTSSSIRLFREVGLCLSREKFAKELEFCERTIANSERGTYSLSLSLRRALDQALEKATDAQRERFLAALPPNTGRALLNGNLPTLAPPAGHKPTRPPALGGNHWQRHNPVTPETARNLLAMSALNRHSYQDMPAAGLLELSQAHLSLILDLHPGWQPEPVRHTLLRAVGEAANLTAVLLFMDLNRYAEALPYLDLMHDAARENNDPDLAALVLADRALLTSFSGGSPALAAEFADAAVSASNDGQAGPATRGYVAAIASGRLAILGDERASRTRLDTARETVAGGEPDPTWAGVGCAVEPALVTSHEGGNLVLLGQYADAVAACDTALAELEPTRHRNRCGALLKRAEAHLGLGQVDMGCGDALAALSIAAHTEDLFHIAHVRRLAQTALPTKAAAARQLWAEVLATPSA